MIALHTNVVKGIPFFFPARDSWYLPTSFEKKKSVFFFHSSGKKKEKKIRTLKNATTKKERKRTKKEIRFSFSIPKFICIFKKNDLVSEKIASEQPNFDTQIY